MDTNNLNYIQQPKKANIFSTLSFVFGILAIGSCILFLWMFFLPILFGGLSVIFAILSKGYELTLPSFSKIGLITGIVGIAVNIGAYIACFVMIFTTPELKLMFYDTLNESMQFYEDFYGESYFPYSDTFNYDYNWDDSLENNWNNDWNNDWGQDFSLEETSPFTDL